MAGPKRRDESSKPSDGPLVVFAVTAYALTPFVVDVAALGAPYPMPPLV
jgi:hypothetical protein